MAAYKVIVIGGGHAGVEAAWAAANALGEPRSVALVTLDPSKIGVMSCNPAIGGLAKGQLVREVDALGGLMGLAADATGIQFKVLNRSKGPAVRGPRCQSDKHAYAAAVRALIESRPEIEIIAGAVEEFLIERGRIRGVVVSPASGRAAPLRMDSMCTAAGEHSGRTPPAAQPVIVDTRPLFADAVVLTTGTFMRGLMHTGESRTPGGRHGEGPAVGVSGALSRLGFELGRLKTGTPPRLRRSTIDWEGLPAALGDEEPTPFSDLTGAIADGLLPINISRFPALEQIECRTTRTTASAHELIRRNVHRAPMFSGQIDSVGPRYCPSIEDKVMRFADRQEHNVFLEPESASDEWVYCNGISTSLPTDVQDGIVRSMPGCERAEILRYGYAVEYDMVRPHQIRATCETKPVAGLFLAGQINGTSGYEEAAAQGVVAGVNAAAAALAQDPVVLGRDEAYIGVLMDDLVTKTPVEPYRMFTSRAEHRLLLRADNAADRLTPVARRLGLLSTTSLGRARTGRLEARAEMLRRLADAARSLRMPDGATLAAWCRRPEFTSDAFTAHAAFAAAGDGGPPGPSDRLFRDAAFTVHTELRYEPYVARSRAEIRRGAEMERRPIPTGADFASFTAMRAEAKESLTRFRPETFGQAARLEGITPADLTLLAVLVARRGRAPASVPSPSE